MTLHLRRCWRPSSNGRNGAAAARVNVSVSVQSPNVKVAAAADHLARLSVTQSQTVFQTHSVNEQTMATGQLHS